MSKGSRRTGARLRQQRAGAAPWGRLGPSCEGKRAFGDRAAAARACFDGMRPYCCPACGQWHVGHPAHRRG